MADTTRVNPHKDPLALEEAIENIARLATDALNEIATLARISLERLERRETAHDIEATAVVLESIWRTSSDIMNCVDCEAENAGVNINDQYSGRWQRMLARYTETKVGG